MLKRLGEIAGKPLDDRGRIWLVTIITIVGLCFAAIGAVLFTK